MAHWRAQKLSAGLVGYGWKGAGTVDGFYWIRSTGYLMALARAARIRAAGATLMAILLYRSAGTPTWLQCCFDMLR